MKQRVLIVGCLAIMAGVLGHGQIVGSGFSRINPPQGGSHVSPAEGASHTFAAQQAPASIGAQAPASAASKQRALLDQYCVTCHNDRTENGQFFASRTGSRHCGRPRRVVGKSRAEAPRRRDASAGCAAAVPGRVRGAHGTGWRRKSIARRPRPSTLARWSSIV